MSRMTSPLTLNPEPLSLYERRVYKTRNPQIVLKMNLNVSPGLKNSITKQANYERIKIAHVLNSKWYQHGMWWGWKHAFPFIFLLYLYFLAAIDDPNHTQKLDIPYRFGQRSLYSFQTIGRFAFLRKRNATLSSPKNQKLSYIRSIDLSVSYSRHFALVQTCVPVCVCSFLYKVRCGIWFFNLGRSEWNKFCLARWFCCVLSTEVIAWILFFIRHFPLHLLRTRI